jgi:hypothetical protein
VIDEAHVSVDLGTEPSTTRLITRWADGTVHQLSPDLETDVLAMIEALQRDARYGPYVMYCNMTALGLTHDRRVARREARRHGRRFTSLGGRPRLYRYPTEVNDD